MRESDMIEVMTKYMSDTRRIISLLSENDDVSIDTIVEKTGINEERISIIMAVLYASECIVTN